MRLRPEFETVRAQLLTRHPRLSLVDALTDVRAEETRHRGAAQMQVVLSALALAPSALTMVPPAPEAPMVAVSTAGLHCTYCQRDGHRYQDCYKRRDQGRRGGRPPKGLRRFLPLRSWRLLPWLLW